MVPCTRDNASIPSPFGSKAPVLWSSNDGGSTDRGQDRLSVCDYIATVREKEREREREGGERSNPYLKEIKSNGRRSFGAGWRESERSKGSRLDGVVLCPHQASSSIIRPHYIFIFPQVFTYWAYKMKRSFISSFLISSPFPLFNPDEGIHYFILRSLS